MRFVTGGCDNVVKFWTLEGSSQSMDGTDDASGAVAHYNGCGGGNKPAIAASVALDPQSVTAPLTDPAPSGTRRLSCFNPAVEADEEISTGNESPTHTKAGRRTSRMSV